MSFAHPERLLLLLGVVALGGFYVAVHLRRRQAVAAYTNPALHHLIAPQQAGWKRHVAPALSLLALAVLLVTVAQPTHLTKVPRNQGVVMLAVDVSASMTATDITPDRISAAIAGAKHFVAQIPAGIDVGLVSFDASAQLLVSPTTDHGSVVSAIDTLTPGPGTAAGEGIYTSLSAIEAKIGATALAADKAAGKVPAAVVLLSDGSTTVGRSVDQASQAAAALGVPVSTIAYGTPDGTVTVEGQIVDVPADTQAMSDIARTTGGTYFEAKTAGELKNVYAHIQTQVGYTTERRDAGRGLLGVAFVALVGAMAAALALSARPAAATSAPQRQALR